MSYNNTINNEDEWESYITRIEEDLLEIKDTPCYDNPSLKPSSKNNNNNNYQYNKDNTIMEEYDIDIYSVPEEILIKDYINSNRLSMVLLLVNKGSESKAVIVRKPLTDLFTIKPKEGIRIF